MFSIPEKSPREAEKMIQKFEGLAVKAIVDVLSDKVEVPGLGLTGDGSKTGQIRGFSQLSNAIYHRVYDETKQYDLAGADILARQALSKLVSEGRVEQSCSPRLEMDVKDVPFSMRVFRIKD